MTKTAIYFCSAREKIMILFQRVTMRFKQ